MKTLFVALALVSVAALQSCQGENTPPNNVVKDKLLGKWKLERLESDIYSPATVFNHHEQYLGIASDSIVFKANGEVYNYIDDPLDPDITEWVLINDTTLSVDGEITKIRELTSTRLLLHSDDTFTSPSGRIVTDAYLYR